MGRGKNVSSFNAILEDTKRQIDFSYDGFDDFINASTVMAKKADIEINTKIDNWNEANPSHEYSGFEVYENEFFQLCNYESQIYYAIMILAYSKFEVSLKLICKIIAEEKSKIVFQQDFKGNGIFQSKKYLEKIFDIDFTSLKEEWKIIESYNTLRNTIVHQNGEILPKENKQLTDSDDYKKIDKLGSHCTISNLGIISISSETITDFVNLSQNVLDKICDMLCES